MWPPPPPFASTPAQPHADPGLTGCGYNEWLFSIHPHAYSSTSSLLPLTSSQAGITSCARWGVTEP